MIFINTDKFSPVIFGDSQPWEEDYFHLQWEEVDKNFIEDGNYEIDETWWNMQDVLCRNGLSIENTIDYGGDIYRDDKEAFWNDSMSNIRYVKGLNDIDGNPYPIPPNSCYIPMYDLLIKNRTLHITGRHYFYLNFGKIYALDNSNKSTISNLNDEFANAKGQYPPMFTDVDWGYFIRVQNMFRFKKDMSEAKARQKGFSNKTGIGVAAYNYTFVKSSQTIIAAGIQADADKTFNVAKDCLDTLQNTQFYKERKKGGDRGDYIKSKRGGSEILSITCKDNVQALSRHSPYMTILEEEGKWKKGFVKGVVQFNKAAQKAQGRKTGWNIHGGTGGDMDMGAADLEKLHYYPEANKIQEYQNIWEREDMYVSEKSGHFTPGWQFVIMDRYGNSKKEESIKYLEVELASIIDPEERYIFQTQNALYASDAFMIKSGGFFGENIVRMVNERKARIMTHALDRKAKVGRLEWKDPKHPRMGCKFENDENGSITIFEEPSCDQNGIPWLNLYKAGTDSYDQSESLTSESKGDIRIFKTFRNANETYNKFVAKCTDRPKEAQGGKNIWYENSAKLCVYYGIGLSKFGTNLIEWSKILIFEWYISNGFEDLLKERPGFVISSHIKHSQTVNRYGIDPSTKPHWLTKYRKFLEIPENIENIDDVEQLTSVAKFRLDKNYNCDTTIACSLCIVCAEDDIEMEVRSQGEEYKEELYVFQKDRNGNIIRVLKAY